MANFKQMLMDNDDVIRRLLRPTPEELAADLAEQRWDTVQRAYNDMYCDARPIYDEMREFGMDVPEDWFVDKGEYFERMR